MAYCKYKDLTKRTQSHKVLRDKAFEIASNPSYDGYQGGLASVVYNFLDQKSTGSGVNFMPNYQLANELHKQIIRKLKRLRVYSSFKDNIQGVDLTDMNSLSIYNKGIKSLLCAIDRFSKYAWVAPIKDKRRTAIVNAFKTILDSSKRKPNKIWDGQGGEFYNNLFKRYFRINEIEIYLTCNEGKSVVAEIFIRTLKNNIYKHMTAVLKNVYFDVLDDIFNKRYF